MFFREWSNNKDSASELAAYKAGITVRHINQEINLFPISSNMEILRKVTHRFNRTKRGVLEKKKPIAERGLDVKKSKPSDQESEIKVPAHSTLLEKRRRSSESDLLTKLQQERKEQLKQSPEGGRFRSRGQIVSCSSYFTEDRASRPYMKDRVLTENAKYLTPEQMNALEEDIFKPLDFYGILFDRMKARDNGDDENEQDDKFTVMDWQDFKNLMNGTGRRPTL